MLNLTGKKQEGFISGYHHQRCCQRSRRLDSKLVSHIINGTRYVKPEPHGKSVQAIRSTNYLIKAEARHCQIGRKSVIAVVIPNVEAPCLPK